MAHADGDDAAVVVEPATKRRAVRALSLWNFAFDQGRGNFASQADQNLALALCGGDSVRTVQMQTYVTSASAVAQFVSNQIIGQWCDTFGRKPLLVGLPLALAALRLAVAAAPCWPTLFAAELANYMMFQVGMTPVHASLGDLFSGEQLGVAMAQVQSMKGVSRIAGNPVGVWLSAMGTTHAQLGAAAAALCAAAAAATSMPETLPPHKPDAAGGSGAKPSRGSINPLNFVQLFNKGYRLGTLTVVSALSDVAEFTFDVDNHLFIAVGMDARLIGLFFMCNGVSSIVAGGLAGRLIPALGPARYTMLAQGCAALSQFAKGFASRPLAVFASLLPYTFGPMMTRTSCVNALHTAEASKAGLAMGELVAARANVRGPTSLTGALCRLVLCPRLSRCSVSHRCLCPAVLHAAQDGGSSPLRAALRLRSAAAVPLRGWVDRVVPGVALDHQGRWLAHRRRLMNRSDGRACLNRSMIILIRNPVEDAVCKPRSFASFRAWPRQAARRPGRSEAARRGRSQRRSPAIEGSSHATWIAMADSSPARSCPRG